MKTFLRAATPKAWFDEAPGHLDTLLIDHANCELKAAASALALLHRYPEDANLTLRLSKLAREELRHFEQVHAHLRARGLVGARLSAGRYAAALHRKIARNEPARLIDSLLVGSIIEARSHERFEGLIPHLEDDLASFYARLATAEARHFEVYLALAERAAGGRCIVEPRLDRLLDAEAHLATAPDTQFRFHGGPLAA